MNWFTSFFSETKDTCMKKCEDKYKDDTTPTETQTTQTTENSYTGQYGGSRRRCTKKHRHTSACKKLKAKKSKGRKSYRKRR